MSAEHFIIRETAGNTSPRHRLAGGASAVGARRSDDGVEQPRMAPPLSHPKKGGPGIAAPGKAPAVRAFRPYSRKESVAD